MSKKRNPVAGFRKVYDPNTSPAQSITPPDIGPSQNIASTLLFTRPARVLPNYPTNTVDLSVPQDISDPQTIIKDTVIRSGMWVALFAFIALVYYLATKTTTSFLFFGIFSIVFVASQGAFQYYKALEKKKNTNEKFNTYFSAKKKELQHLQWGYVQEKQAAYPSLTTCLKIAQHPQDGLWAFTPKHQDFLAVRIGISAQKCSYDIQLPKQSTPWETSQYFERLQELQEMYSGVKEADNVPSVINLREVGVMTISGQRDQIYEYVNAFLIKLATHHAPTEVKFAFVLPPEMVKPFRWVRWLPHVWEGTKRRFIGYSAETIDLLATMLTELLEIRKNTQSSTSTLFLPHHVLLLPVDIILNSELDQNVSSKFFSLLEEGSRFGISIIILSPNGRATNKQSQLFIDLAKKRGELKFTSGNASNTSFIPDMVSSEFAENFARTLTPIQLTHENIFLSEIPQKSLLDLLGIQRVENLSVVENWSTSRPYETLALPVGVDANGDIVYLDIHENGNGIHGLVGGTTGYGKGELLKTITLSAAIHYHPHELCFIFIDYKGAETAKPLSELPHVIGVLSNLETPALRGRILRSLRAEIDRRQKVLEPFDGSINKYQRAWKNDEVNTPLPHLVLVVDEFAEFKDEDAQGKHPQNFVAELVSISRLGRSLGIHLILSTQTPGRAVNADIKSNSEFRFAFRFKEVDDSKALIDSNKATTIYEKGVAYFQTKQSIKRVRIAYSGEIYQETGRELEPVVQQVLLDGSRQPLAEMASETPPSNYYSELQVISRHINSQLESFQGLSSFTAPWLNSLPDEVYLSDLLNTEQGWNGKKWLNASLQISPVIGLYDNPDKQEQDKFHFNFSQYRNTIVVGDSQFGKTTFLQTTILSLLKTYSPKKVSIYCIDFRKYSLNVFSEFPHIGSVCAGNNYEKVSTLLKFIQMQIESRKKSEVSTLRTDKKETPAIFLFIDGLEGLKSSSNLVSTGQTTIEKSSSILASIMKEGVSQGVYCIASVNHESDIPHNLSKDFQTKLSLTAIEKKDVGIEQVERFALINHSSETMIRIAYPATSSSNELFHEECLSLRDEMKRKWNGMLAPIPPDISMVVLEKLLSMQQDDTGAPIGLDRETLLPVTLTFADIRPSFLITGSPQNGKTNCLKTILYSFGKNYSSGWKFWLINAKDYGDDDFSKITNMPQCAGHIKSMDDFNKSLVEIKRLLQKRKQGTESIPKIVIAIDNFKDYQTVGQKPEDSQKGFLPTISKELLALLDEHERDGLHVIISTMPITRKHGMFFSPLLKNVFDNRSGGISVGSQREYLEFLGVEGVLGWLSKDLGAGVYVSHRKTQLIQVAKN